MGARQTAAVVVVTSACLGHPWMTLLCRCWSATCSSRWGFEVCPRQYLGSMCVDSLLQAALTASLLRVAVMFVSRTCLRMLLSACACALQAEELPTIRHHRRTHSGGTQDHQQQLHQLPEQQQHQQSALALKVKAGRSSLEAHPGDLISTAVHTATLIPASLRDRLESNASSGARFFSAHHDNNFSTGDSTDGSGFGGGGATAGAFNNPQLSQLAGLSPPRVQLDVGFEGLGLKLKSCGKMVLQGVTGSLTHGRLAAVMGPSGAGKYRVYCGAVKYSQLPSLALTAAAATTTVWRHSCSSCALHATSAGSGSKVNACRALEWLALLSAAQVLASQACSLRWLAEPPMASCRAR